MSKANTTPLLTQEQEVLLAAVKLAHRNLIAGQRLKVAEIKRRLAGVEERIKHEVESEIVALGVTEDETLIAAFEGGVPIKRIALDGFGNRHEAAVHSKLKVLREEGRVGYRDDYQRGNNPFIGLSPTTSFPKAASLKDAIEEAREVTDPNLIEYEYFGIIELVQESADDANDGVYVPAVRITMHDFHPYFEKMSQQIRPGSPHQNARTATLFLHPGTGNVVAKESEEVGETYYDHPVARWVKEHQDEARTGLKDAVAASGEEYNFNEVLTSDPASGNTNA